MERPSLRRMAHGRVRDALGDSRVVLIHGPRQSGKTTIARAIHEERPGRMVSLDRPGELEMVLRDPEGFVEGGGLLVVDEFQRAGDRLLLAIKHAVDGSNRPGQFLITGSADFLTIPTLSESLAGRVEIVDLWPLSQGEIEGTMESFPDRMLGPTGDLRRLAPLPLSRRALFERVLRGGFPEAVHRLPSRRASWFEGYARTVIERDAMEITRVHHHDHLHRLVRLLAARTATEARIADLARELEVPRTTLADHLPLLRSVFLFHSVPAWSRNLSARAVRSGKLHLTDTGLAGHFMGQEVDGLMAHDSRASGPLLETFVAGEIARQRTWSATSFDLHHYRDGNKAEIDLILAARDGRVSAVEVKAAVSIQGSDFRHLEWLRDRLGDAFVNGVVLHAGERVLSFGDRMTAMPVSALWAV